MKWPKLSGIFRESAQPAG